MPVRDLDSYSFPPPSEALRRWLDDFVLAPPSPVAIVAPASWDVLAPPQVRPELSEAPTCPRGRGQPRRDRLNAAIVAMEWDIYGMRPTASDAEIAGHGVRGTSWNMETERPFKARQITGSRDTWTSKSILRWRDDGRRVWAAWGAWPWALTRPDGKLPRSWWKRPEYTEALRDWAAGRLP